MISIFIFVIDFLRICIVLGQSDLPKYGRPNIWIKYSNTSFMQCYCHAREYSLYCQARKQLRLLSMYRNFKVPSFVTNHFCDNSVALATKLSDHLTIWRQWFLNHVPRNLSYTPLLLCCDLHYSKKMFPHCHLAWDLDISYSHISVTEFRISLLHLDISWISFHPVARYDYTQTQKPSCYRKHSAPCRSRAKTQQKCIPFIASIFTWDT